MRIDEFIAKNKEDVYKVLKELCLIPAPSHFEHKRAEYVKNYLEGIGAKGVYIDEALNVVFPLNCEGKNELTVLAAHTDTVFPDMEPLPYYEEDGKIYCPAVSDDTAGVVVILFTIKYFLENNIVPEKGILFVLNSCEEGLGDLKGTRKLFEDYDGRIASFLSVDGDLDEIIEDCVGSHRYEITVETEGGHSFSNFGRKNAINEAAKIINAIYEIDVPKKEGKKSTLNVGTITGGTSVNTIAPNAVFLCEYRSDDFEGMAYLEKEFLRIFKEAENDEVKVIVKKVGDRPCANIERSKVDALKAIVQPIIEEMAGKEARVFQASTDCNIPLSKGIPGIAIGSSVNKGIHTREEWLVKETVITGLEMLIKIAEKFI